MSYEPTRTEGARILALLGRGGSALQKDLKPAFGKSERDALLAAGFITAWKDKTAKNAFRVELTDAAWCWAQDHLDAPTSLTGAAGGILHDWMGILSRYMAATGVRLAEVLSALPAQAGDDPPPQALSFAEVRAAAVVLGRGQTNVRVRLKDLRRALPHASRDALDDLLRHAAGRGDIALYHLDDPRDRGADDEAASIDLGGRPAHILYVR